MQQRVSGAQVFLSCDLCVLSPRCCLLVQVQDESVSVRSPSLWLQLEFVAKGSMSSTMGKAKEQGMLLIGSEIDDKVAQGTMGIIGDGTLERETYPLLPHFLVRVVSACRCWA